MNLAMLWDNVVAYSLQIGLLVALAAVAPAALRLKMPRARLLYWQILLGAILLLPLLRPPQPQVATGTVQVTTTAMTIVTHPTSKPFPLSRTQAALLLLAAGALCRLVWLGIGLGRLSRYRRHSMPLAPASSWSTEADLRIAPEISSPVTFGFVHPVVLLPPQFPDLDAAKQDAILCHEILHVRRRDWLFTVAEELVRAVFWFHPAIWWLLGEIQLAREQAVDREVIEMTKATDEYVDALLAIAGAHSPLDLAPAPLFLRKRHLKQRVVSILKEVRMSKKRWITSLTVATGMLAAACWFVTAAFPLAAAPQTVTDGPGITVDTYGVPLLHRSGVFYPFDARNKGIQGTVVVQVKLDSKGEVADVSVMSGPEELRRAAIQSVLSWHFAKETAGSTRQVSITFVPPKEDASAPRKGVSGGVTGGVIGGIIGSVPSGTSSGVVGSVPTSGPSRIKNIDIRGFSDEARNELRSQLPVHEGDELTLERMAQINRAVNDFDPHAMLMFPRMAPNEVDVVVRAPGSFVGGVPSSNTAVSSTAPAPPGTIRVGGNVQQAMLVEQPHPIYPELAKQARISGVVTLNALIGKDGHVENLTVVKGHPLLVQAALDAVKNWVYKTTLLNGQPVQVQTTIDVNFTLME